MQIRFGAGGADVRLQPAEKMHVAYALDDLAAFERNRQIDVSATPHEALRHDADDRAADVVEPQLAAEDVWIPAELPLPEAIAQHGDRRRAGPGVGCRRSPSDQRRDTHHVERVEGAVIAA